MKAELFHTKDCDLAEGPVWHDQRLWWVDIEAGQLLNSEGDIFEAPFSIGSALPCTSGRWILAEEDGFSIWDLKENPWHFWTRPDTAPEVRFNDAKVAPDGSVWAGTLQRGTLAGDCVFYRLNPDFEVTAEISGIGLCNGLDWFGDHFYYTDTGAQTVLVRNETQTRIFAKIEQGYPDGLTVDRAGNIWLAIWGEGQVIGLHAETAEVIATIEVPVPNVSSCCFGGDDLETLYITTARQGLSDKQLEQAPLSGSIFCCRPGAKGFETRTFNDGEAT
jgi:sugar lactone lactonase YvrE